MLNEINEKILNGLNPKQKAAVIYNEGHLRIIAGAGSGKTSVLTKKIAYLIENNLANPEKILAVTFTNKATNEMKERIFNLVEWKSEKTMISTFHSLCNFFLRREIKNIKGYHSNFDILDSGDQKNILENIYRTLKITNRDVSYSTALEQISKWKNLEMLPSDIDRDKLETDDEILLEIYELYYQELSNLKALDFDDLMIFTLKILKENIEIRKKWSDKFSHILVDEFQDTSDLQFDIIKYLLSEKTILTVVGDPDQTIYTWRGAKVDLILNFDKTLNGVQTITLDQNYRSTNLILNAANSLIKNNKNRLEKNLFTENISSEEITFHHSFNVDVEARWVAEEINELKRKKVQLKNIAILYRSGFYSRAFEDALIKENIPYQLLGGVKFFEKRVVKDLISYLKVVNDGSTIGFHRIINVPSRKIGPSAIQKIVDFSLEKKMNIFDSLIDYFTNRKEKSLDDNFIDLPLNHSLQKELVDFLNIINLSKKLLKNGKSIAFVLETIVEKVKYISSIKNPLDKQEAQNNLNSLLQGIKNWENKNPKLTLNDYLLEISLLTDNEESSFESNAITMMTIHSSKGLEFSNVFLVGMAEGISPSKKSLKDKEAIEEERRLIYVAITRAKERLFISDSGGNYFENQLQSQTSRFVSEMGIKSEILQNFRKRNTDGKLNYRKEEKNINWLPGDIVNHIVFGEGVVLELQNDTVVIKFKNLTEKDSIKKVLKNHKSLERIVTN
ncbi:ATP-dependent helicase [Mesomycoplasma molare]|uniref:DNA 3'-5' helicase n=1 Tax=Mesomycoplasma molare TaxID=171288 RepID=A0ABY5TTW7_9BACT|nr:UvrD-helicase domain-containing protein [Mesomycoplasma molare]UWD34107.1 UvrD-helicase domain-containing protein [Mesomycoplasma molare]